MSAIVLSQGPAINHHFLPEVLSQTINYILSMDKTRVELYIFKHILLEHVIQYHLELHVCLESTSDS